MYFVPLAIVVSGVMLALYWLGAYSLSAEVELASRHLLNKNVTTLRARLKGAAEDVRLLADEAGRLGVFDRSPEAVEHIKALTGAMVRHRKVYQVVRILDIAGREAMRMEFTPAGGRFVGGPELIARPPWEHVDDVLALGGRRVCIFPAGSDDKIPSAEGPSDGGMCLATVVYDQHRNRRGVAIIEYRPSRLFGDLAAPGGRRRVMLLDADGTTLCNPAGLGFGKTFPDAWDKMAANRSGRFYTSGGMFVFLTVDPMYALNDSDLAAAAPSEDGRTLPEPIWKLVGHIPRAYLPAMNVVRQSLFGSSLSVLLMLLAAGSWRLARFSRIRSLAEQGLHEARQSAEFANASKTEFLANMSHEIRTPMTAVLGYSNLLMDPDLPKSERAECLQTLQRNGEHLLTLINDILDISKIEAGKLSVRQGACDVVAIIAEVVSMMRIRALQRDLTLSVEYAGPMPATIVSDGSRVRQTLINLVGNAVKFTDAGQVRVVARFLPTWGPRGAAVQFDVIDTGVGIEPDQLERMFQPFTQADAVGGRHLVGSGLGLAISRSIVRLLGGDLTAASTPGVGSTFTMVLPAGDLTGVAMLANPHEAAIAVPSEPAPPHGRVLKGLRILLAEDGPDNQKLIRTLLEKAGAKVATVDNGADAAEWGASGEYDLIFMDMQMPTMDGFEAAGRLRAAGVATPVVALTAHALDGDRDRCIAAGCADYLSKPIDRNRLIDAALRNTGGSPPQRECEIAAAAEVIASELADAAEIADLIDEFVDGLPKTIAAMTDALIHGHFAELSMQAHRLRGSGGGFGYPSLTDAAAAVEDAAIAEDPETATLAMMILISVCQAINRGRKATVTA